MHIIHAHAHGRFVSIDRITRPLGCLIEIATPPPVMIFSGSQGGDKP